MCVCLHWNCSFIGFRIVQMDVEQLAMFFCFLFSLVSTSNWYYENIYIYLRTWVLILICCTQSWVRLHLICLEFVSSSHMKYSENTSTKSCLEAKHHSSFLQSNNFWVLWLLSQRRFPSPANRLVSLSTNPFKSFCRRPAMKFNRWEAVGIHTRSTWQDVHLLDDKLKSLLFCLDDCTEPVMAQTCWTMDSSEVIKIHRCILKNNTGVNQASSLFEGVRPLDFLILALCLLIYIYIYTYIQDVF